MDFDHYSPANQQQRPQQQQQQQWAPHLHPHHPGQSAFPSPVSPPTSLGDTQGQYQPYFQGHGIPQQQQQQQGGPRGENRTSSSLSLNLSSLSVTSPTNLSPINPSPLHTHNLHHPPHGHGHAHSQSTSTVSSTMSPVTPISPSNSGGGGLQYGMHHPTSSMQHAFQFSHHLAHSSEQQQQQQNGSAGQQIQFGTSSRSSSASEVEKRVPHKRSFSTNPQGIATPTLSLDEGGHSHVHPQVNIMASMFLDGPKPRGYDDVDMNGGYTLLDPHSQGTSQTGGTGSDGNVSPIGSGSGEDAGDMDGDDVEGEREDQLKPLEGLGHPAGVSLDALHGVGVNGPAGSVSAMGIMGKPIGTNNFVTKLYQMINDSASSRFISWTDLGTSFVVSNVGEFSRSILGSHFKHNNFSSFVRQLNMYGFHKINRTPRSQRNSTDSQTWEFSHHKFLRGRADLLDEIKRKALEPDPTVKHRVELPGEMVLMREENRRVWEALVNERKKVERMVGVMKTLWDVVGKGFPGRVPPFPQDLLEPTESPNIYITSPTASGPPSAFPPPLSTSLSSQSLASLHSMGSPNSSPTATDFPHQMPPPHAPPPLSRQHSFQQMVYPGSSASSTPLPSSPGSTSMDLFEGEVNEGRGSSKRQRTSNENLSLSSEASEESSSTAGPKRLSRARSDSAPLGYGFGTGMWQSGTRPRSGSGMAGRGMGMGMPRQNGNGNGGGNVNVTISLHSLPSLTNNSPGR